MDTIEKAEQPVTDDDCRRYRRLTPAQVQIVNERIRSDRSIILKQVAEDCGMSRSMFYFIIRGKHRTTPEKITSIAHRLQIDPKEICA